MKSGGVTREIKDNIKKYTEEQSKRRDYQDERRKKRDAEKQREFLTNVSKGELKPTASAPTTGEGLKFKKKSKR